MPILQQREQEIVRQRFETELKRNVNITLFTQRNIGGLFIPGRECASCGPAQQMLDEVSALSPKISLEVIDFFGSRQEAKDRGIERIPAIIVSSNREDNVRFYGLPAGFEFAVLLDTIVSASDNKSPLQLETRKRLRRLSSEAHIQVFVTPN